MAEVEIAGAKIKGGKLMLFVPIVSALGGGLWGGFEVYKDYMDMKAKLSDLEPEAIQQQIDVAMVKLDEGVTYARDIKNDLRSDVIQVEKSLGQVEARMRELESQNREMVQDAQRWFDERTAIVDRNSKDMEQRLQKQIQQALTNALEGDQ